MTFAITAPIAGSSPDALMFMARTSWEEPVVAASVQPQLSHCTAKKKSCSIICSAFIFLGSTLHLITYLSSCQSICAGKTGQLKPGRTCCFCFCQKGQRWKGGKADHSDFIVEWGNCSFFFPLKENSRLESSKIRGKVYLKTLCAFSPTFGW